METQDEEEISLSQVPNTGRKVRFTYEYDFGDSWDHEIVLEKTLEPEPKVVYPRCVDGGERVLRRMWAVSGAMRISLKPSGTGSTRAMTIW